MNIMEIFEDNKFLCYVQIILLFKINALKSYYSCHIAMYVIMHW